MAGAGWAWVLKSFDVWFVGYQHEWEIPHDAHIAVEWSRERDSYVATSFEAIGTSFEPVTIETLREMPVARFLGWACRTVPGVIVDAEGRDMFAMDYYSKDQRAEAKDRGPVPETLDMVARLYRAAGVVRWKPAAHVAMMFDIPQRTATHWVKLARERGHLGQTVTGGAVGDG